MKVDGLKARVAKLERALEQTMQSFTRFQTLAIEVDNLPPKIALEISRTALDIASVAQRAHSGEPLNEEVPDEDRSGRMPDSRDETEKILAEPVTRQIRPTETAHSSRPSNPTPTSVSTNGCESFDLLKWSSPTSYPTTISTQQNMAPRTPDDRQSTWFAAKLLRQCLEKGVRILTSPNMTYDDLHPALTIHLTWVSVDELRVQSVRAMANNFENPPETQGQSVTLIYPDMYRSVEGDDRIIVPRMPTMEPQQLVPGRTRTKLDTNLHDFLGEWLEPIDVQEYLEWKGIFVGDSGRSRVLQIAIPETTLADIWTQDAGAIFTEEIQRSSLMSTAWPFGIESQDHELRVPDAILTQPTEISFPTIGKQSHVLAASNPEQSIVPQVLPEIQTQNDQVQHSFPSESYPPGYAEQLISVTLNLERLMKFLIGSACCIGPGPGIRREAVDHALRVSIVAF